MRARVAARVGLSPCASAVRRVSLSQLLAQDTIDGLVDELALPLLVVTERAVLYANTSARLLADRLQREHATDLAVLLRDHVRAVTGHLAASGRAVTLVTAGNGEPFYIHLTRVVSHDNSPAVVACVRQMAPEREAVKTCYRLSEREAEVLDLVLRGYGNRDIAAALEIAPATAKKHLTSIFDKVGVDSRSQLISRLA
jgi:DNA-binding CsgD family transcriptional regulator